MISKKLHNNDLSTKEYDCFQVNSVTLQNEEWFYLDEGFDFKDIHDLIKQHTKSHTPYFRIISPESDQNETNSLIESIQTTPQEPFVGQDIPRISVEKSPDLSFMHGEISKEEAEDRLAKMLQESFL